MMKTAKDLDHTELTKSIDGDSDDDDGGDIKNEQEWMREKEGGQHSSVSTVTYQTLSPGGGVADGEVTNSPGCSGMRVSAGEPGPCMPGGVDEALRVSVAEPLRDTQEVSITRTPILEKTKTSRVTFD